jgi:hypothetical protein
MYPLSLKKSPNVYFSSRRGANAGRVSPVMRFVCHPRRQGTPMPFLLPSAKCRLPHFTSLREARQRLLCGFCHFEFCSSPLFSCFEPVGPVLRTQVQDLVSQVTELNSVRSTCLP